MSDMRATNVKWLRDARPDLRRAFIATIVVVVGMVAASLGDIDGDGRPWTGASAAESRALAAGGAILVLVAGVLAVRALARAVRKTAGHQLGDARSVALSWVVTIIGYLGLVLVVLGVLEVPLGGLLFGGAVTGVVLGIAAQQTLANFFAGIVLLIARPLSVGEEIVLRSGTLGGQYEGRVRDMTLFYVNMETEYGPVALPNAGVLAAAIGPGARAPEDDKAAEPEEASPQEGGAPGGDSSRGSVG